MPKPRNAERRVVVFDCSALGVGVCTFFGVNLWEIRQQLVQFGCAAEQRPAAFGGHVFPVQIDRGAGASSATTGR
jgi:hypothetical protein